MISPELKPTDDPKDESLYGQSQNSNSKDAKKEPFNMILFVDRVSELFKKIKKISALKNQEKNSEEDALAELSTLDQKVSDIRKKTLKRIFGVMVFFSFGLFIIFVLAKWGLFMWRDAQRPEIPTKVQELKLEVNSLNKWQEIKDQQITQLGEDIKKVETNVDKKISDVQNTISSELNDTKASVTQSLVVLQDANKQNITDAITDIKNEIKLMNDDAKQYTDQKNLTISEKIAQMESKKRETNTTSLDYSKLSLPPLPELGTKQEGLSPAQIQQKLVEAQKPRYVEEDINDNPVVLPFSTMNLADNNTTITLPKMTMMAGVQRATLVAGADVPTLQKGNDLTRVVWLSTSGDMLIANGHTANIKECIIQADATGNFATSSADIRLAKISCSALDIDGKYYKLVGKVKGWVNGETGKQGLKGRLVTKEGELIEKAVPLAILEGAIKALENSTKSSSTIYTYPGASASTTTTNNLKESFAEGTTKTASTTLDKFSDYYLMILEQLNPTIELKAGREVSIWFEGGEQLTLEEYTPLDVDYFENKGLEQ